MKESSERKLQQKLTCQQWQYTEEKTTIYPWMAKNIPMILGKMKKKLHVSQCLLTVQEEACTQQH